MQQGLDEAEVDDGLSAAQETIQTAIQTTIQKVRQRWSHHIICCTNDSVKDDGTPINSEMPQCRQIYAYVELEESEHVQLSEHVTELVGE